MASYLTTLKELSNSAGCDEKELATVANNGSEMVSEKQASWSRWH